jgi:hypothetical protein
VTALFRPVYLFRSYGGGGAGLKETDDEELMRRGGLGVGAEAGAREGAEY